jgi:uncharacterized membrane protein
VSRSWRVAAAATFALLALQWIPPVGLGSALWSLPLLPPAVAFLRRRPRAPLWAGIVALLYFCLGIAAIRVEGGPAPWLEMALSLVVVFAAGWPGIAAKLAKRRPAPPPNV